MRVFVAAALLGIVGLAPADDKPKTLRVLTYDTLIQISAAVNADGRISLFGLRPDFRPCQLWQIAPSNHFSERFVQLGASYDRLFELRTVPNSDGRISVFGVGMDSGVYHLWQVAPSGTFSDAFAFMNGWLDTMVTSRLPNGCVQLVGVGANDMNLYGCDQVSPSSAFGDWYLIPEFDTHDGHAQRGRQDSQVPAQTRAAVAEPSFAPPLSPAKSNRSPEEYAELAAKHRLLCRKLTDRARETPNVVVAMETVKLAQAHCAAMKQYEKKARQPTREVGPKDIDGRFNGPVKVGENLWIM